jgi:hypothetical protein
MLTGSTACLAGLLNLTCPDFVGFSEVPTEEFVCFVVFLPLISILVLGRFLDNRGRFHWQNPVHRMTFLYAVFQTMFGFTYWFGVTWFCCETAQCRNLVAIPCTLSLAAYSFGTIALMACAVRKLQLLDNPVANTCRRILILFLCTFVPTTIAVLQSSFIFRHQFGSEYAFLFDGLGRAVIAPMCICLVLFVAFYFESTRGTLQVARQALLSLDMEESFFGAFSTEQRNAMVRAVRWTRSAVQCGGMTI